MSNTTFQNIQYGIFIVVILLLIMYVVTPDVFESYILMNIPMYRLNAIKSMRFKDKKLNKLLNDVHANFTDVLLSGQKEMCKDKEGIIKMIKNITRDMKKNSQSDLNKLCNENEINEMRTQLFSTGGLRKPWAKGKSVNMSNVDEAFNDSDGEILGPNDINTEIEYQHQTGYVIPMVSNNPNTVKLSKSLFDLFAYALNKFFCKGKKFDVDLMEEYLIAMVDDACSKTSNIIQFGSVNSNYLIRKPLSYGNN